MINILKKLGIALAFVVALAAPAAAQFADQATYAGASTGSANAYAITVPNVGAMADVVGVPIKFLPNFPNTGDATLAITGLTPVHIYKPSSSGPVLLTGGELVSSPAQMACGIWDGTHFTLTCNINAVPAAPSFAPQGYVTPCPQTSPPSGCTAGQILPTGDVTAATALYYEPVAGNNVPIYNGSAFISHAFTELTLTLGSSNLANTIYDICIYDSSGSAAIGTTVAWSTSSAGSGNRGSGAGTAQITKLNGVYVNAVQATVKNGATTATVAANQCTIVGSVYMDGTNGQVSFTPTFGASRKWGVSNIYNKQPILLNAGVAAANWTYGTNTLRPSDNLSTSSLTVFMSVPEQLVDLSFSQQIACNTSNGSTTVAIGWNSTTVASGMTAIQSDNTAVCIGTVQRAMYNPGTFIGINVATSLEASTVTMQFNGNEVGMSLLAKWPG